MSFNLSSGVETTAIIWPSQSLNCLSVWSGRKWIETIRDEESLARPAGEIYFPSLGGTTSSHTLTGQHGQVAPSPLLTYHYQSGGSEQ